MKEICLKDGRVIKTKWLRIDEAAAYCGISRFAFTKHARDLPHGGDNRTRLYDEKILDAWIRNELPNHPFALNKDDKKETPVKRTRSPQIDKEFPLVHPNTGKIY